jgi:hypothetical protein
MLTYPRLKKDSRLIYAFLELDFLLTLLLNKFYYRLTQEEEYDFNSFLALFA